MVEELDRLSDEELQKIVTEVSVFARTTPNISIDW